MRVSQFGFLALAIQALTGCGTIHNLKDRPHGPVYIGSGSCYPFGGVVRSGLLATMGPPIGLAEVICGDIAICQGQFGTGFEQIGHGMLLTALGLGAIVDVPLSLAGDNLTFPIAYARSKEYPWATWWGERSYNSLNSPETVPDEGGKKSDAGIERAD